MDLVSEDEQGKGRRLWLLQYFLTDDSAYAHYDELVGGIGYGHGKDSTEIGD